MESALAAARWIWLPHKELTPHTYVIFRKTFPVDAPFSAAQIDISVDSDFVLYVNGAEVGRGQFSDWPARKTWTRFDVAPHLRTGKNVVGVLAYWRGEDFSDYRAGRPGLIAALVAGETIVRTDGTWFARRHPAFQGGPVPRVTNQMGFTTSFDARKDVDWLSLDADERDWPRAMVEAEATGESSSALVPRPVPPVVYDDPPPVRVVASGFFVRTLVGRTVAEKMAGDALMPHPANQTLLPPESGTASDGLVFPVPKVPLVGSFAIVDLGREEEGLLTFTIDAPAGVVIEIAHGEHLDDGRVRAYVGNRNFADRYLCREGENRFTLPFRRLGCRYLEIHVSQYASPVRLRYLGIRPARQPMIERRGGFSSPDPLANRLWETAVRTIELCAHDHFEDCPWREQSLYAYDSRMQAIFGYYAFGHYDFAAASWDLLGRGLRGDGLLELCAPAKVPITIPIFSFAWANAVADHWRFGGDPALAERLMPGIETVLATARERRDGATGLYRLPPDAGMWHFYEWVPGLEGNLGGGERAAEELHAMYNLHLHDMLGNVAWMRRQAGDTSGANELATARAALGKAIHRTFWDATEGIYRTRVTAVGERVGAHAFVQALALHEEVVPRDLEPRIVARLDDGSLTGMTLSSVFYAVRALMERDSDARRLASRLVSGHWEPMAFAGATSFWETEKGGDDFGFAGSLCHGWSALPVLWYQGYVLGVHPIEPGFRRFLVRPYPDRLARAEGTIPTPAGPISVAWRTTEAGLVGEIAGPTDLEPVLSPYPEAPVASATYNGKPIAVHADPVSAV